MCVEDYQFRHHSARREKILKRFVFRSDDYSERAYLVNISQFEVFGQLCLCDILLHLHKKGLDTEEIEFYMPQFNITVEANYHCRVPFEVIEHGDIVFQIKPKLKNAAELDYIYDEPPVQAMGESLMEEEFNEFKCCDPRLPISLQSQDPDTCCQSQCCQMSTFQGEGEACQCSCAEKVKYEQPFQKQEEITGSIEEEEQIMITAETTTAKKEGKRETQPQKTIRQALQKCKMWRMIHEVKNYSLKKAATFTGLPKKSLDDYFLAIRVGEHHGYNFKDNMEEKIGHLRSFIRSQSNRITGRLPKSCRSFDLVPHFDLDYIPQMVLEVYEEEVSEGAQKNRPGAFEHGQLSLK